MNLRREGPHSLRGNLGTPLFLTDLRARARAKLTKTGWTAILRTFRPLVSSGGMMIDCWIRVYEVLVAGGEGDGRVGVEVVGLIEDAVVEGLVVGHSCDLSTSLRKKACHRPNVSGHTMDLRR